MNTQDFIEDIPRETAIRAFNGTSFSPEDRGFRARQDYANVLRADYEDLLKHAKTDEEKALLESEFARYREGYKRRYLNYLYSHSRVVSTMIAGPSNFPVARMEKMNRATDNKSKELSEFRERALKAIVKKLCPECRPIMAGDENALERLQAELDETEKKQAHMVAVNKAMRANRGKGEQARIGGMVAAGATEEEARELIKPGRFGGDGFRHFELSNNNAKIKRLKDRIAQVSRMKAAPIQSLEGKDGITIEDCPPENRIRLYFPGKPDAEVRDALKRSGYRWTPSLGCWQAYRNSRTFELARSFKKQAA